MVARQSSELAFRGQILNRVQGEAARRWGTDPGDVDPLAVRALTRRLRPVFGPRGYLRVQVRGWENLPPAPALAVSNHSGGTWAMDAWGFNYAWSERFGGERPLHTLAHEVIFGLEGAGRRMARLGVLRAAPRRAQEVLQSWRRDVLVMPGGDRETWRPWRERYQVNFAGRRGYARLAIRAGVPVVPVAHAGAHDTLLVLTDGARVARLLRLPQLARAEVFPVHLSLPWGLAVGPVLHLPPPTALRYRIGAPIPPPVALRPGEEPPEEAVEALDRAVQASIQAMLIELRGEVSPGRRAARERAAALLERLGR